MKSLPNTTPEELRRLLDYDPETGKLFWKPRPEAMFQDGGHTAAHICARWNSRFAGREALTSPSRGYLVGAVRRKNMFAHRVAWAIHYGQWPAGDLDHINGNGRDNRIENLREVNHRENMRNTRRRSDNTSGVTGVSWNQERGKWAAYIKAPSKVIPLGRFDTAEEAIAARKAAEKVLGYHQNHGR